MAMERTAGAVVTKEAARRYYSLGNLWKAVAVFTLFYLGILWYERMFAFSKGLDYFSEDFRTYWLPILQLEIPLEILVAALLWGWIWKTRDRALDRLSPQEELARYFGLGIWLGAYTFAFFAGASFFTEQDGAWHQTVIRDTDFTPSHILEFYLSYPVYIITGIAAYLWARTRLPKFAKGHSFPFLFLVGGPMMVLVNVALNEFGHTAWEMEEVFVAPLHWGFVILAVGSLGLFGVWLQCGARIVELLRGPAPSKSAA